MGIKGWQLKAGAIEAWHLSPGLREALAAEALARTLPLLEEVRSALEALAEQSGAGFAGLEEGLRLLGTRLAQAEAELEGWEARLEALGEEVEGTRRWAEETRQALEDRLYVESQALQQALARLREQVDQALAQEAGPLRENLAALEGRLASLENMVAALEQRTAGQTDPRPAGMTLMELGPGAYPMQGLVVVLEARLDQLGSLKVEADGVRIAEYLASPGRYRFNPVGSGYVRETLTVSGPGAALIGRLDALVSP